MQLRLRGEVGEIDWKVGLLIIRAVNFLSLCAVPLLSVHEISTTLITIKSELGNMIIPADVNFLYQVFRK
jgi:hypothetical protein